MMMMMKWQLFQISARPKLLSMPLGSLLSDIGHLEESFLESIM